MDNQQIRIFTTGILHTKVDDLYTGVEYITGEKGVMTHMLPRAFDAMQPWLRARVTDPRFWDGKFDPTHTGETVLPPMTEDEKAFFWKQYSELPNPLEDKRVVTVAA